jgi:hypothetical protein
MSRLWRVRPPAPDDDHFEELPVRTNLSKQGIYFPTCRADGSQGMGLVMTYPFTFAQYPNACEYLAEVVRVEVLTEERVGVAARLLTTV